MKIKTWILTILVSVWAVTIFPQVLLATPDQYMGDTSIYSGNTTNVEPNVLIILDNSGSMNDTVVNGDPYSPATIYSPFNACGGAACQTNAVYRCTSFGAQCNNWVLHVANVSSVTTSCGGSNPRNSLLTTGQWNSNRRSLRTNGTCSSSGSGIYGLGNWINWATSVGAPRPKIDVAKEVVTSLVSSTSGVRFGLMIFNTNNQGGHIVSYNGYTADVKDMDAIFSGTTTNRQALMDAVGSIVASTNTPLGETLFEAMRYYSGQQAAFSGSFTYTSPIEVACQQNYVILVTDGMSTSDVDPMLKTICNNGDCDGDGFEPANDPAKNYSSNGSDYLDDVAKYMHDNDMSTAFSGTQNVITYTVGFGLGGADAGAVKLLSETAQNGGGQAFEASNAQDLSESLTQILGQIFEVNTSFVAPVVPVSPENRTYSGSRVYLGFFKPQGGNGLWLGNLKKFAIDDQGNVVDKNGNFANYVDNDGDGVDDRDGTVLPSGGTNGSFRVGSTSYWSATPDEGIVDSGGTGELLQQSATARNIYTYLGNTNLTNAADAFTTTNTNITTATLGVTTNAEKDNLINFVHGFDSYDEDSDGDTTEKRGWVLGDILHAKPLVVNYTSYTFSTANEADCAINKTLVYVGGNDGMLHAFKDCDGSEAWAFIPQDLLINLGHMTGNTHTYFVDSSPSVYIYDANNNGNIESGDKVIMLFGERRGGGFYYALDITNPVAPVYLWRLSSTESPSGVNTDYSEMGESWSEPTVVKMRIGTQNKIVAVIGAGYDNNNEDGRFGATQTFDGTGGPYSDVAEGNVTSTGVASPVSPKGRGVYIVEIATLDSAGVPSLTNSGWKLWGHTYGASTTSTTNPGLTFSMPSAATVLDRDFNGYADRIYVGDMGGNIWRFDIGNTNQSNWSSRKIFSSNPGSGGSSDAGRKIFYRPSITFEVDTSGTNYEMLFFGTGDREHPLNTAVVDRMYAVKDRPANSTVVVEDHIDNVHELVDVTTDDLQASTATSSQITTILADLDTKYGWFIMLDQNTGEKVLAPALAFVDIYYTTYTPISGVSSDPCTGGNLGTARVYLVNSKTGEAVYNAATSNDSSYSSITNTRAQGQSGEVLQRGDRSLAMGSGIPSGVVLIITNQGGVTGMIGCGGSLCIPPPTGEDNTVPIYWRRIL
jgi:type IV pilus assembly protein PilY1